MILTTPEENKKNYLIFSDGKQSSSVVNITATLTPNVEILQNKLNFVGGSSGINKLTRIAKKSELNKTAFVASFAGGISEESGKEFKRKIDAYVVNLYLNEVNFSETQEITRDKDNSAYVAKWEFTGEYKNDENVIVPAETTANPIAYKMGDKMKAAASFKIEGEIPISNDLKYKFWAKGDEKIIDAIYSEFFGAQLNNRAVVERNSCKPATNLLSINQIK